MEAHMAGDFRPSNLKHGTRTAKPKAVDELARGTRSNLAIGVDPDVLVRVLRAEGNAAAALELALWQVQGEIAATKLGDPTTPGLRHLRRQRRLLLDVHGKLASRAHGRLRRELGKADAQPAVKSVIRTIAGKRAKNRKQADFMRVVKAYEKLGGFPEAQQEGKRMTERAAAQRSRDGASQAPIGQSKDGISGFRPSARMPTWRQTLHREHLRRGVLPIPAGVRITGKRAGRGVSLGIDHRSRTEAGRVQVSRTRVSEDGSHLILEPPGWPADFFPGIVLEMSWIPERGTFVGQTHELDRPLVVHGTAARIDGRHVGHRYDPRVVARETAPGGPGTVVPKGLSETDWVLRALHVLGYLDAEGRAILAEDALERNMVGELGFPRGQVHRISPAVAQLIGSGLVNRVTGSLDSRGTPVYPPVPGRTPVTLLSFSPFVPAPGRPEAHAQKRKRPMDVAEQRAHTVSGFVRRLPAGHSPSDEAIDAHKDAQRAAELANREPLKPGYTFVRRHHRNGEGIERRRR
ncbi:hypothetical protein GCM10022254_16680 [Actinomadura meridiana]|uniref:Transposase n=1 Tax=Actinomadura meridiana TaxID=559626 RepID=A0ABP8BVW3_9ACTN